jgi:hypothetical protein
MGHFHGSWRHLIFLLTIAVGSLEFCVPSEPVSSSCFPAKDTRPFLAAKVAD